LRPRGARRASPSSPATAATSPGAAPSCGARPTPASTRSRRSAGAGDGSRGRPPVPRRGRCSRSSCAAPSCPTLPSARAPSCCARVTAGLLAEQPLASTDWLLIVDDDVELPCGFLDGLLFLAERYHLTLAQPAQTLASHAAWDVVRRRPWSAVRETSFVEIGPVTALHRDAFAELLPFPPLRAGWGLDAHWAAIAAARGWRLGVVDALPVRHELRPVAGHYAHAGAVAEARAFLADRPYLPREQVRTLVRHRGWRRD
jgi:hypothetical protein